jgi:nitronate monooxygenase
LVASGAGGHAGTLSPFALVGEVRKFFKGPIALSGSIATGDAILAPGHGRGLCLHRLALAGDQGIQRQRWLPRGHRRIDRCGHRYSNLFTGVHGNYLKKSIVAAGLDPDALPTADKTAMNFGSSSAKAWRDIWGAGQGVGLMDDIPSAGEMVERLKREYDAARARLAL